MAALGAQSIASSYEQLLHVDADGGGNSTTHVSVKDGDNGTTFGFTIASDALMMSSTNRLEFGDTGTYIFQSADGVLDLVSDTEIEINATTIDMNGALDLSGNAQLSGTVTVGADGSGTDVIFYSGTAGDNLTWDASDEKLIITGTNGQTALDVADGNVSITDDLDVNGTTNLDAVDIDGNVQLDGTFTVGTDGSGQDVILYSGTAGDNFTWDSSEEKLTITGTNGQTALDVADGNVSITDDLAVDGTSNLDNTDIDGTLAVDGATISLDATTSFNIDNTNTSNGVTINTATSGGPISIGHSTSETTVNDNLVVTGDIDLAGSIDCDGTANLDIVDIDGAVQIDNTITVGADNQGYDIIFYGDTASSNMTWDTSGDDLILNDSTLSIVQDDDAYAISIDMNGNAQSINIDSESTDQNVIHFTAPACTTATVINVDDCNSLTGGRIAFFYSNSSSNTARNLVEIRNDHASADNAVGLLIQQDGADASIELTGNGSIKFPGTQGASSDANSLDDYEEGTWTPVLGGHTGTSGQSYGSQNGTYTKVGRSVTCCFYVDLSTDGSISGDLRVLGLPFTCGSGKRSAAALGYITKFTLTADHYITNYVEQSSTHIHLLEAEGEGDSVTSLAAGAVEDGTQLMGSVTYFV